MSDFLLIDGDTALFLPGFGAATVVVQPGTISGSASPRLVGTPVCVEGDEESVKVPGCTYSTPQYCIPGVGTLRIQSLSDSHVASRTVANASKVLLLGGQFEAAFDVQMPAQQPPPGPGAPIPDATPSYSGQGFFVTSNARWRGT